MSVQLAELKDECGYIVQVMAPSYDKERLWLWDESYQRIDLTIKQAKQLRDFLVEELPL